MAAMVEAAAFFNLTLHHSSSPPPSNPHLSFRFHRHKSPSRALIAITSCFSSSETSHSQLSSTDPEFTADSSPSSSSSLTGDDSLPEKTRDRRKVVRLAWEKLVRWSRSWRSKAKTDVLERTKKVVVLGGGSFGTAMAAHIANKKNQLEVHMLIRDPIICRSINEDHRNCKYFPEHKLPENVIASTDPKTALVNFSAAFLEGVAEHVDLSLPFISLSKGLELNTLRMMSQIIPQSLRNPRQPFYCSIRAFFCSGVNERITNSNGVASKDKKLANAAQQLLASSYLRISTSRSGNCRCP